MNRESVKPSAKQVTQKGEVSVNKKKFRLASKSNLSTCRAKPGGTLPSSKSSRGPSPADVPRKFCKGRPREERSLKLGLVEMGPRDPGDQASQGIQDFIKQVSSFIEKKNPFKVVPDNKRCPAGENDLEKNRASNRYLERPEVEVKGRRIWEKSQALNSRTCVSTGKGANSLPEGGKADEAKRVRRFVGGAISMKREVKAKPSLKTLGSRSKLEGRENGGRSPSDTPTMRPNQIKRPGRSEIPLRKTRTDLSRNPKPVSLLMQKPLKEIESAISIDLYSKKKPFTPIEELSLCSEIQSRNVIASSEKLSHVDQKSSPRVVKKEMLLEEAGNGFKLDRCFKSPNIPVVSKPSYSDVTDKKLCTAKRSKVLDLDKVRTSSFTVLQDGREALCRLESLHQQNVSTKENVFGEKFSSSKLKMLTPKSSFNSLKGKGSKKNLSTRLSSKGNKPALKVKTRKSKKDLDESLIMLKKSQKANGSIAPQVDTCQKAVVPADVRCLTTPVRGRDSTGTTVPVWNEEELMSGKVGESNSRSMSSGDKETTGGQESVPVNAQLIPKAELEELDKEVKTPRNSSRKAGKHVENGGLDQEKSKDELEFPLTGMESNSAEDRQTDEDERSSSKTVVLGRPLMDEASSLSSEDSHTQFHPARKTSSKGCEMVGLTVKGTSLKFGKDEPPEKPEGSEPKKNKLHIKINLTTPEDTDCEENVNNSESLDRLYLKSNKHSGEEPPHEGGSSEVGNEKEEEAGGTRTDAPYPLSRESTGKEQLVPPAQKARKSSPFLRSRLQYKVSGANLKGVRKKKIRSDAGDRRLSSNGFFKSVSLQNKIKLDTKLRSGLTKAYTREEKRDLFDDNVPIKLKRRNSEPISFRGYIWKRADAVTPRGHKASVSSMASSLKHLNTDDIDDFIFWEAVPQKMTSCWEMSLYHFKRPWSVLSCSVFEDNRQSSTPGLILENLRNGGSLSPRLANERAGRPKDSPFDVEPSIVQKNIDIRNWLAALNFPTLPSTSIDVISEGNFSTQSSIDAQNPSKGQVSQRRRKMVASLRFAEDTAEKKTEEKESKYKKSTKWNASEVGGLMDLIRRKSGGFVTNEQFLNSEHSIHRPNVTVNLCLYSKTPEEKPAVREGNDRNVSSEPKTFKAGNKSPSPEVEKPALSEQAQPDEVAERRLVPVEQKFCWGRVLKGDLAPLPSDLNIWKYLFLFTLLIISVHYCFLNNSVGRG